MKRHVVGMGLVGLVALVGSAGCAGKLVVKQMPLETIAEPEPVKVALPRWEGEVRISANDDQDFDRPGTDSELLAASLQRMLAGEGVKAHVHCVRVGGSLATSAETGVGAMHARVTIDFQTPVTEEQKGRVMGLLASLAPSAIATDVHVAATVAVAPVAKPDLTVAVPAPVSAGLAKAAQAR
jgi:hypothetical protein